MKQISNISNSILKAFVENSQESVFITDEEGRLLLVNSVAEKLLSVPYEKMKGKTVEELIRMGYWKNSSVIEAIKTKKPSNAVIYPKNGKKLISRTTPIFNQDGELILTITNSTSEDSIKDLMMQLDKEKNKIKGYKTEIEQLKNDKDANVVANSASMKNILERVDIVAQTESTVVLYGESGTGKDVIANIIHRKSKRHDNVFLSINCAAVPDNLIESEMFGYEKGAFTGADSKGKIGIFEAAEGGTIFLDEIGEISLAFQSKLLRVLENEEIRKVGGTRNIPIDVRIICATSKNLKEMVPKGLFREDLYYRLNVFPIELTKLAERTEDIIPLAENFLQKLNTKYQTHKIIGERFKNDLMSYPWPGNIRELRNIVERAYLISEGETLDYCFFTDDFTAPRKSENPLEAKENIDIRLSLKEYVKDAEKAYINMALKKTEGNVVKAAKLLGIHRTAIYRKLNE
jgi:PAS modulated sigma54 specific transcriptional regulator, fis family